jgi:hypothetical protein
MVSAKNRRHHLNPRNEAVGHVSQDRQFSAVRGAHLDVRIGRQ